VLQALRKLSASQRSSGERLRAVRRIQREREVAAEDAANGSTDSGRDDDRVSGYEGLPACGGSGAARPRTVLEAAHGRIAALSEEVEDRYSQLYELRDALQAENRVRRARV
jgi:hypothetical protein